MAPSRVDGESAISYTREVRRSLALLTACSLGALQLQALASHTHAADALSQAHHHQHGPAIHHHRRAVEQHASQPPVGRGPQLNNADVSTDAVMVTVPPS